MEYLKNYAKTRLTYRVDFWIEVLSDLLFQAINLIFILIVFQHTPTLGGWTEAEVVFVYRVLHGALRHLQLASSTSGISANGILSKARWTAF